VQATTNAAKPSDETAVERVRQCREELLAKGKILGENGLNEIFPIGLTAERGRVLREVCLAVKPVSTLEVGLGWGISTLFIFEALLAKAGQPIRHVVIDPFQATIFHNASRILFRSLGLEDKLEIYEEDSLFALTSLLRQGRRFDFVFIDGDHRFDACFVDMCIVNRLLRPGGVVLFDDTWLDAVNLTAQYAVTNLDYTEFKTGSKMMRALVKPEKDPERNGLWTERLVAFWPGVPETKTSSPADLKTRAVFSVPGNSLMLCQLDSLAGQCRAGRIMAKSHASRAAEILSQVGASLDELVALIPDKAKEKFETAKTAVSRGSPVEALHALELVIKEIKDAA